MKVRIPGFGADRFSGLYLAAVFILIFAIWVPGTFLTSVTLHSVASDQAITALVALALLIPLTTGTFDLTVGSVTNLTAILVVTLQVNQHWGMWQAIIGAIVAGAAIGAVSGFIVVVLKVNSFIATLGMSTVILAVQTIVSSGVQPMPVTTRSWTNLTQRPVFGFQAIVLYMLVAALVIWWVLDRTPVGRYFYSIGSNPEAARLTGIAVDRWVWLSLIASGTLAGTAGVLYSSLVGPSLTFGQALLLPAFAAVFLGSTQLDPGRPNAWGTIIALYVLGIGVAGLQLVTGVQWLNDMFSGIALLAAVSFAVWRQRAAKRAAAKPGKVDATDLPATATNADAAPPPRPTPLEGEFGPDVGTSVR